MKKAFVTALAIGLVSFSFLPISVIAQGTHVGKIVVSEQCSNFTITTRCYNGNSICTYDGGGCEFGNL